MKKIVFPAKISYRKALEETIVLCGMCQEERKARDAQLRKKLNFLKELSADSLVHDTVNEALLLVEEAKTGNEF